LDGRGARRRARLDGSFGARRGSRGGEQARPRGAWPHHGRGRGGDPRARPGALRDPGPSDGGPHRGRCLRISWIQPEDLIGHELRQAAEEGKDVESVEHRWFGAGGKPAPGRGASQEPVSPELRELALELLDELEAIPRPLAADEPEELEAILAVADPVAAVTP